MADIDRGLSDVPNSPAVARGRREVAGALEQLDAVLTQDLFKELGPLSRFPADDQVLQRREGYRDVFRAYLEFELAAQLHGGAQSPRIRPASGTLQRCMSTGPSFTWQRSWQTSPDSRSI